MKKEKDSPRENLKNATIAIVFILAVVAWVREGWRLTEYDSKQQMELAEDGGFSDKATFLAAQAVGINSADKWNALLAEVKAASFSDPAEFLMAKEVEISQPNVWETFKKAMIKDGFEKPRDYKEFRLTDFQSRDEFYEAKRLGSASRVELLGDLADEKFRVVEVGSDKFVAFCTSYASAAFEIVQKGTSSNKQVLSGLLAVVMARYMGNFVLAVPKNKEDGRKLAEWMTLGKQSGIAGFLSASSGKSNQSTEYVTFKKCMDNVPELPDRFLKEIR